MINASKKSTVTEEVDFTGCDPDVAEALRSGKAIKCICWDVIGGFERMKIVIAYMPGQEYPYLTTDSCYLSARPVFIETVTVVKSEVEIMKGLIEHGYRINRESGTWYSKNCYSFVPCMWERCGKVCEEWIFEPWMLEEIEKEVIPQKQAPAL